MAGIAYVAGGFTAPLPILLAALSLVNLPVTPISSPEPTRLLVRANTRSSGIINFQNCVHWLKGVVSEETVVLRRWGSSTQKFDSINGVGNVN